MIAFETHADAIDPPVVEALVDLFEACFGETPSPDFGQRLAKKRTPCAMIAYEDGLPIAFKLGYERTREEFYSRLGGVHPNHRRRGIAGQLMKLQHDWCRDRGYRLVSTETLRDNTPMLVLNLRAGLRIDGTRLDDRGLKILLSRAL